jgi:hypothetical protein
VCSAGVRWLLIYSEQAFIGFCFCSFFQQSWYQIFALANLIHSYVRVVLFLDLKAN